MKRTGLSHSKLKRLKSILSVPEYVAVGILETIWHLTAREAPQGNIGKMSDQDIAMAIEWNREPSELIDALVESKWFDRCRVNRLVVHDWKDHCDNTTKLYIKRNNLDFVATCNDIIAPPKPMPLPMPEPMPEPEPAPVAPCVQDFPVEVQRKADEVFQKRWFALKGCLPNYERQDARQELREIADKVNSRSDGYEMLMAYFAGPPPPNLGQTPKLWQIFKHVFEGKDNGKPSKASGRISGQSAGGGQYEGIAPRIAKYD